MMQGFIGSIPPHGAHWFSATSGEINMLKLLAAAVIAASAIGVAAGAREETAGKTDVSHVTVIYGDLDLNRPAGAKAMLGRIDNAAHEVCGARPRELERLGPYLACVHHATVSAVAKLHAPLVTAAFERSRTYNLASAK
jgi:UrcA family protein